VRSLPVLLLSLGKHGWSLCLAGADKQTQISEQAQYLFMAQVKKGVDEQFKRK
jgi:hypothetical protein